jgi:hypothetical protein
VNALLTRHRNVAYFAINAILVVVCGILTVAGDGSISKFVYVAILFALCSSPLLFLDAFNGKYALLAIFMPVYFLFYGMLDLMSLLSGAESIASAGFMSEAEFALLCGAAIALSGYGAGVALAGRSQERQTASDWSAGGLLAMGSLLWLAGSAAIVYFQVSAVPEKTIAAATRGFAALGPLWTFALMLGQMVEPLGLVIIAYGYARFRTVPWFTLTLVMVLAQVAVGFVSDIKSLAMLGGILVILARTLVDNKLPRAWIMGSIVLLALAFPAFQAYRADVAGGRGLNRQQAVQNLDKVLEIVLANRSNVTQRPAAERSQTFFERASLKANVELAFAHTGIDTPFQEGHTLVGIPGAFIPRLLWPDKPDVSTGTLFNKEFIRTGQADTNISPSHLGELYWNFGWPGIVLGMAFIGMILGFVGARYNLANGMSVTRLLVLLATVKYICLGFEGTMAVAYVLWLRSMGAIGLLHIVLAQRANRAIDAVTPGDWSNEATPLARFPNLMR